MNGECERFPGYVSLVRAKTGVNGCTKRCWAVDKGWVLNHQGTAHLAFKTNGYRSTKTSQFVVADIFEANSRQYCLLAASCFIDLEKRECDCCTRETRTPEMFFKQLHMQTGDHWTATPWFTLELVFNFLIWYSYYFCIQQLWVFLTFKQGAKNCCGPIYCSHA